MLAVLPSICEFLIFNDLCDRYNSQLVALKRELKGCKGKLADQHKQLLEYSTRMDEYDKKFEESSRKFSTVLQVRLISFVIDFKYYGFGQFLL